MRNAFWKEPDNVITAGTRRRQNDGTPELEQQGLGCALEVARQMIQEQVRDGGTALPWADRILYTRLMFGTVRSGITDNTHEVCTRPFSTVASRTL